MQTFFTYPETCGKTIEEIEVLFGRGGPRPWATKPGGSRLDGEIQAVIERKARGGEAYEYRGGGNVGNGDGEKGLRVGS